MSSNINYKSKYMELRSKYMNDIEMSFRLGFEQGQQQAQNEQMLQAQAQQQQMEQAAQGMNGESGQPGQEASSGEEQAGQAGEEQNPSSAHPEGSELDQHIAKLEQMIAKSELQPEELKKHLAELKQTVELRKSSEAIKGIAKALHKPAFKMSVQASHNLSSNAKNAVSMQHKIVNDVMAKMEAEEERAAKDIKNILNIEGLTKKE